MLPEPFDDRVKLKVKIKSLAKEAKFIRHEEARFKNVDGRTYCELHDHRVHDVRREARATHLAYSFVRGKSLEQVEPKSRTDPDWTRVEEMVKKYGARYAFGRESYEDYKLRKELMIKCFHRWKDGGVHWKPLEELVAA